VFRTLKALVGVIVMTSVGLFGVAAQADKIKVAGIYTQPIQQKWDAALHKALVAAQAAGEIDYVFFRESRKYRLCAGDA